jgi:hypothetical protein
MSDTDKDRPDSPTPREGTEAKTSGGAVVISIEQARAELLAKPRQRPTPQMGVARQPRPRAREVPAPVTMPPGEHAAVIVTDTPAARAHVDKKTVHPGEMPAQTHEKKVRVKTSLDPRRMKTQMTDRRAGADGQADVAEATDAAEVESLWNPASQPPSSTPPPASVPPPASRPSLARSKPLPRDKASMPLFVLGVVLAAALGAGVVFFLSRPPAPVSTAPTSTAPGPTATAALPPAATSAVTAQGGAPATSATVDLAASAPPSTTAAAQVATSAPVVKATAPTVKTSATASAPPTATAKPTATSVLPFGVGHD